ncbi:MAG TPA: porphobilinogen synthase, partial [Desulfobulbaceae bacterium]|nr:porphobilinogen synthase [Desulfobulbaceae bacterium]
MIFPEYRPRRMRKNKTLRAMIRETRLSSSQMIYPLFIMPGKGKKEAISSMP